MPIENDFVSVPMMGNVVQIPVVGDKAFAALQLQRFDATDEEWDDMLQSLVDLLQTWEYRRPDGNVMGQKYVTGYYNATPTNPVVLPVEDPEQPPEGGQPEPAPNA